MFHGFRLFGHPLHPIMNHLPIGLLSVAPPFDILGLWSGSDIWWAISYWNIVIALIAGMPTVITGIVDYLAFVRGSRPDRLALIHLTLMLSALGVFVMSLVFRHGSAPPESTSLLLVIGLDCFGTLLLMVGGWFGGELVYGHGVGFRDYRQADI
jgi:uncharacterized membrane protein